MPVTEAHLPPSESVVERTQIVALREVQGVNALATDQHMGFELDGMTIIFGYNGSGKSGYARILRSLCHARHRGDQILQNAYVTDPQPTPAEAVDCRVGDANRSETWQQGQNPPADL